METLKQIMDSKYHPTNKVDFLIEALTDYIDGPDSDEIHKLISPALLRDLWGIVYPTKPKADE